MSCWINYKNGNYIVHFNLENGTKIRENDLDNLTPAFAENCDVKITDKCDGGCEFCYEGCTINGRHGDILNYKFFDTFYNYLLFFSHTYLFLYMECFQHHFHLFL